MSSRQTQVGEKYITSASLFLTSKGCPPARPRVFLRSLEQAHSECSEDQAASGFFLMSSKPLEENTGHPQPGPLQQPSSYLWSWVPFHTGTRVVSVKHIPLLPHPSVRPCDRVQGPLPHLKPCN